MPSRTAPFRSFLPPRRTPRTAVRALPTHGTAWPGLRYLLAALLAGLLALGLQGQVAINTTGAPPTDNAMLDISHTSRGLLVPRMTRAQRMALPGPVPGLLVYQTDSVTTDPRGFYYYDMLTAIGGWKHLAWGPGQWQLGGNAGTTNADFLGSINNEPLVFRISNYERGRLSADGELQLYYSAAPAGPTGLVHVQGAVKLNGGSNAAQEGTMRYTTGPGTRGKFEGYIVNTPIADASLNGWKQLDNNFGERRHQESPLPGASCQLPTSPTDPAALTRPWPVPGPTAGPYGNFNGPDSPYYTIWEDSRKQYLFLASDLIAAGICPNYPINAIAFNVTSVGSGSGRIHFLRIRMKNTAINTATVFDNNSLVLFSLPMPGPYAAGHTTGYTVTTGWNVHAYDQGSSFVWSGNNLLLEVSVDNQEWSAPSIRSGAVQSYNTGYNSMLSMFCDACGGAGPNWITSCKWIPPPPTTPTNGTPDPVFGANYDGWGYRGGWTMTNGTDTRACDGQFTQWQGGGQPSVQNALPRVAFHTQYTGGGSAYRVGNYMYANEGFLVGDAAWAATGAYPNNPFKGPGTLTAKRSVWSGNTLLNDYVFDLYYDGQARPEDAAAADNYVRTPLKELPNYVERERRLPTIDGRAEWNSKGLFSVDKLGNQLWVTVEEQALYIQELNARMEALQQYLIEKKLQELEGK